MERQSVVKFVRLWFPTGMARRLMGFVVSIAFVLAPLPVLATLAAPNTATGSSLFSTQCTGCHTASLLVVQKYNGANPAGLANTVPSVLAAARTAGMFSLPLPVAPNTTANDQLADIAAYLGTLIGNPSPNAAAVPYNSFYFHFDKTSIIQGQCVIDLTTSGVFSIANNPMAKSSSSASRQANTLL